MEASIKEKMAGLNLADKLDPEHPKNKVLHHEIVIDDSLEQTKEFTDLMTEKDLGIHLNKQMKLIQSFKATERSGEKLWYNTYRNGFVSAIAMSYNYHLPLVLEPQAVWLTVIQGFKLHMKYNADKDYIKLAMKNLKKLDATVAKSFSIEIPDLISLSNMNGKKF